MHSSGKKVAKWNLLQDFVHISGQRFETDFRLFEHARSILKALKLNDDEKALNDLVLAVDVSYSHTYIYIMHVCVDTYIYILFCFLFKYVFMHFWNYSGCWTSQSSGMVFSLGRRPFRVYNIGALGALSHFRTHQNSPNLSLLLISICIYIYVWIYTY